MHRMRLNFKGRVQGVGFRYYAQMNATKYHVTGWVRNEMDGSVTAEAQGSLDQIVAFVDSMSEGHRFTRVDEVTKEEIPAVQDENKFIVRYS